MLEVIVHIDPDLGISVAKVLAEGATVSLLKDLLVQDDPTGRTCKDDFLLLDQQGKALDDNATLTWEMRDVFLRERSSCQETAEPCTPVSGEADHQDHSQLSAQAVWEVLGGGDRGGILVRLGAATSSPQLADRLVTGSFVAELSQEGERLRYRLLAGTGPGTGWISTNLKGKVLVQRRPDRQPADFPADAAHCKSSEPSGQGAHAGGTGGISSSGERKELDPYALLGVPHDASDALINSAFRKVSLRVHPDHCRDDPEAPQRFRNLTEAKALLLDPGRRHMYDMKHGILAGKGDREVVSYGTEGTRSDLVPIMLKRELGFAERLAIGISDMRTGKPTHLPLQLFAAKDGTVRIGARVVELALMMGTDPTTLAGVATMDAVCEGEEMPQLRANGEEEEDELPQRSGDLNRAIVQIMDFPKALGLASSTWLKKNNSVMLSQMISQRLTEVAFEADLLGDPITQAALATAQHHTAGWWSSG